MSGPLLAKDESVEVMPVAEHEALRRAAEEVIANAQRERHGLSSVADTVLNALGDALGQEAVDA